MADISNQLHDAVDTILSSFEETCRSLASSSIKTGTTKACIEAVGSESAKIKRACIRTAAEVIGSLKRPQGDDPKYAVSRSSLDIPNGRSTALGKTSFNGKMKSVDTEVHEKKVGRKNEVGIVKEEFVLLSSEASDESSDVPEVGVRKGRAFQAEHVSHKSSGVHTENIGGWQRMSNDSRIAINQKGKYPVIENEASEEVKQSKDECLAQSKKKLFIDKEKSNDVLQRQESMKERTSKIPGSKSAEDDVGGNSNAESMSEQENKEDDMHDADVDNESEDEEPPVLPRQIRKRKFEKNNVSMSGKKELKGRASRKTTKTPPKKQKLTQVDAGLLKKLEYYKRPKNSVSSDFCFVGNQ